jgi:hypothetical protein
MQCCVTELPVSRNELSGRREVELINAEEPSRAIIKEPSLVNIES